ncbi:MAG TPA: zinc-binding dehydrogenase [Ignavibacteria bacterium]|nr:zinc-binding dehydrogenase [Ignavibacteria bacterium]HMR39316.1 zinc-binding dehydrogenase [Ignavibacteria bacterium]
MRAVLITETGFDGDFHKNLSIQNIPDPEAGENDVLVNIKFAALNHRDLWIIKGAYSKIRLPVVPGSDCSGVVVSAGKNVTGFLHGDEVIINPGFNWGDNENFQSGEFKILGMPDNGTLSEYIAVNKNYVYKKPAHLSLSSAAAIPLTGITAFRSVFKKAELKKTDRILIPGIGSGVSTFVLLFAVSIGVSVFVTSGSNEKIESAISLGAEGGVNYNSDNWEKELSEISLNSINVVIDGSGGNTISKCMEFINYGGRIVCYGATSGNVKDFPMARLFWKQLKIFGSTMGSPEDFNEMIKYIEKEKISPVVDKIFKLDNISDAFERMNNSEQFGKIVVEI